MASKINEDGVSDFTNNMDNAIIYVDKLGFGDLITFQKHNLIFLMVII